MPAQDDPAHNLGIVLENNTLASLTVTKSEQPKIPAHGCSRRCGIGLEMAEHTIAKTTQRGCIQHLILGLGSSTAPMTGRSKPCSEDWMKFLTMVTNMHRFTCTVVLGARHKRGKPPKPYPAFSHTMAYPKQ